MMIAPGPPPTPLSEIWLLVMSRFCAPGPSGEKVVRSAPTMTVGLYSAEERLDLLGQSGSLPFDSFRARSVRTTEESGQKRPKLAPSFAPQRGGITSKTLTPSGKFAANWKPSLDTERPAIARHRDGKTRLKRIPEADVATRQGRPGAG